MRDVNTASLVKLLRTTVSVSLVLLGIYSNLKIICHLLPVQDVLGIEFLVHGLSFDEEIQNGCQARNRRQDLEQKLKRICVSQDICFVLNRGFWNGPQGDNESFWVVCERSGQTRFTKTLLQSIMGDRSPTSTPIHIPNVRVKVYMVTA